jgi:hypothetical protein
MGGIMNDLKRQWGKYSNEDITGAVRRYDEAHGKIPGYMPLSNLDTLGEDRGITIRILREGKFL